MNVAVAAEAEPPSLFNAVDSVLATAHAGSLAHVAVIGRHALPVVLALLRHGCPCVRSLRPDTAAPDCEAADLAWIVDVESAQEFDQALKAAHRRARLVMVEGTACRFCPELGQHAGQAGLEVVWLDHLGRRVMLASRVTLARAA